MITAVLSLKNGLSAGLTDSNVFLSFILKVFTPAQAHLGRTSWFCLTSPWYGFCKVYDRTHDYDLKI